MKFFYHRIISDVVIWRKPIFRANYWETDTKLSLSLERYCNPERLKIPHSHLSTADTHLNYVGSNIQWATRSKPLALAVIFYRKQINT